MITFNEAIDKANALGKKKQILLGNGFSIGCDPIFKYRSLFDEAKKMGLEKHLIKLLERHQSNFEEALKSLDEAVFLTSMYGLKKPAGSKMDMKKDYVKLRNLLAKTISDNHPDYPSKISTNKFKSCHQFLKKFDAIFTLNYDLLLYWAALHIEEEKQDFVFVDWFGRDDDPEDPDCSFNYSGRSDRPYIFYLHGALHLYTREGHVWKRVWNVTTPIITKVREAFGNKEFPLVVTEGLSEDKMRHIEASSYLYQAYKKFSRIEGHLFIYGFSLGEQDNHLITAITKAYNLSHLWIGLYGSEKDNKKIINRSKLIQLKRDDLLPKRMKDSGKGQLAVEYFDVKSANVWS